MASSGPSDNRHFDPEAIKAMSVAFDTAVARLFRADNQSRKAIAMQIIALASRGERDPDRLAEAAMKKAAH